MPVGGTGSRPDKPLSHVVTIVLVAVVLAACAGRELPERRDPPPSGQPAEIGVAYAGTTTCFLPFELGGTWWVFDRPISHQPPDITIPPFPFSIWAEVGTPYAKPGIVTLISPTTAVFRADSDGSEFGLTALSDYKPAGACL